MPATGDLSTTGDIPATGDTPATGNCPLCGGVLYRHHCKQRCETCGRVVADCSDPFRF